VYSIETKTIKENGRTHSAEYAHRPTIKIVKCFTLACGLLEQKRLNNTAAHFSDIGVTDLPPNYSTEC